MGKLRHLEGSGLGLPPVSQLWSQGPGSWDRPFWLDLSLGVDPSPSPWHPWHRGHPDSLFSSSLYCTTPYHLPSGGQKDGVGRGPRSLEKGEKLVGSANMGAQICFIFKGG